MGLERLPEASAWALRFLIGGQSEPLAVRSNPPLPRSVCVLLLLASFAGCSSIDGDVDLSPLFRTANHPGTDFTDTDFFGPFGTHVRHGPVSRFGLRPLFLTERRPYRGDEQNGEETVTSFVAPFGKYHSNPRTTQLRFWPLFWYTKERTGVGGTDFDFLLFPILMFGSTTPPPGALAAGEESDAYFALFPLAGQVNSFVGWDKFQFLGWPLLQRVTKRVFDEEEAFTSFALLFGYTTGAPRGGSWHILPLFSKSVWNYPPYRAPHYPEGADPAQPLPRYDKRSYLWPFVHYQKLNLDRPEEEQTELLAVWPLFKRERGFDHEFWTILWPFFRYNIERPLERESARLEAENQVQETRETGGEEGDDEDDEDDDENVLVHFLSQAVWKYEQTQEYRRRRLLLLLYADYKSLPEERENRIDSMAILQPIGFWKRTTQRMDEEGRYRDDSLFLIAPLFQTHERSYLDPGGTDTGDTDRFTKLWPVFSYERNADGSRDVGLIPLLPLRLEKYVKDFNDAWGVFTNLYRYQRTPDQLGGATRHTLFMNLFKAYSDEHESSISIPVLFTSRTLEEGGVTRYSRRFLMGMFGYEGEDGQGGERKRTLRLFWLPIDLS